MLVGDDKSERLRAHRLNAPSPVACHHNALKHACKRTTNINRQLIMCHQHITHRCDPVCHWHCCCCNCRTEPLPLRTAESTQSDRSESSCVCGPDSERRHCQGQACPWRSRQDGSSRACHDCWTSAARAAAVVEPTAATDAAGTAAAVGVVAATSHRRHQSAKQSRALQPLPVRRPMRSHAASPWMCAAGTRAPAEWPDCGTYDRAADWADCAVRRPHCRRQSWRWLPMRRPHRRLPCNGSSSSFADYCCNVVDPMTETTYCCAMVHCGPCRFALDQRQIGRPDVRPRWPL